MIPFLSKSTFLSAHQPLYTVGVVSLNFDEKTLTNLIAGMTECKRQHPEYSSGHPMSSFYGPVFVMQVVYKNLLGTWFMGTGKVRIKSLESGETSFEGFMRYETIPSDTPLPIKENLIYQVNFSSDDSTEISYLQVSEYDVKKALSEYSDIYSIPSNLFEN